LWGAGGGSSSAGASEIAMFKKVAGLLRREFRFLHKPLNAISRLFLLLAAVAIAVSLFYPLWKLHLVAPQYSDGLDLYIYSYKIEGGGFNGQHLVEINNLNHYIGMKPIQQADFLEMRWMPFVFGLIILLILRSIVFGEMSNVVDLFAVYVYFGVFSIGSFWYRLYQYGHELDPHAPMHIKPFTPLLIGVKQIANFRESSFPQAGAYLLCASVLLILVAGWWSRKEKAM
jgi:copper chaperone NosL